MTADPVVWATTGGLLGGIAGSFLGTLVIRWERGTSIVRGRSTCDACGAPLAARDLVPLLSFILACGRCRRCAAPMDRRHLSIEFACLTVGSLALGLHPGLAGWAGAVFGWLLVALGALDASSFWLPDRLTAALALSGLAAGALGAGPPRLEERLLGGAIGFAALALLRLGYRRARGREGLGGGDAKMFGAIGAWLGWQALPIVALAAASAGLAWVSVRRLRGRVVTRLDRLPLGTLLAGAAYAVWLVT